MKKILAYPFVAVAFCFLIIAFLIHGDEEELFEDWFVNRLTKF